MVVTSPDGGSIAEYHRRSSHDDNVFVNNKSRLTKRFSLPEKFSQQTTSNNKFYCLCILVTLSVILAVGIQSADAATTTGRRAPQISQPATNKKPAKPKVMHPAFANAGRKAGLEIWRVENFEPVAVKTNDYGKFHTGDSYVVLFTKEFKGQFSWDIHFWLGSETSQDEAGTAAILSVELDDQLGGAPVQYREVQNYESQQFLSHFKGGIRYAPGGAASGFTHVDPNAPVKRMFQVKGKRNIRVREVQPNISSMNKGDCFILDVKNDIYVYCGTGAKRVERIKAVTAANQIRDQDYAGRSKVHVIDESARDDEYETYFAKLGSGSREQVPDESTDSSDDEYDNKDEGVTLYRVSDATGKTTYEKVTEKPLKQTSLNTNDCFFLDTVKNGIYAWIGKKCSNKERQDVMTKATNYIAEKKYPSYISVKRIVEGGEPTAFKQYFQTWQDRGEIRSRILKRSINADDENEFKLLRALQKSGGKAQTFMPDNGDGETEVYRVENMELAPVDEDKKGMFYSGDSYVIKYNYGGKYIIYFWQGASSSQDERSASAIHARNMDDELGGKAMQIRLTQDNETAHFLHIFKGKLIVLMGGKASGFKNTNERDSYDEDGTRLFRVRGTVPENVRAVQLPEVAESLNSDDVFVLETPENTYIWNGTGSNAEERAFAETMAEHITPGRNIIHVNEGEEPSEFWSALGGEGEYDHSFVDHSDNEDIRLFHCHISKLGKLKVEEIDPFTQEDLDEDDVMVLDTGAEIYVWIGNESSNEEKAQVMRVAKKYVKKNQGERTHKNDVIVTVKQGEEPASFKELFPSWDDDMWANMMSYDDYKQQMEDKNNEIED